MLNVFIIKQTRTKPQSLLYLPFGYDFSVSGYFLSYMYYGNYAGKVFTYLTPIPPAFFIKA